MIANKLKINHFLKYVLNVIECLNVYWVIKFTSLAMGHSDFYKNIMVQKNIYLRGKPIAYKG